MPKFLINRESLLCLEIEAESEAEAAKLGEHLPHEKFHVANDRTWVVGKVED